LHQFLVKMKRPRLGVFSEKNDYTFEKICLNHIDDVAEDSADCRT
jgi:hypothetical protein